MNVTISPHIMQQCKEWDINCFQLCLLIWIKSLEQEQEGRRHFNQREVAAKLGVSRETVNKNLAVLLKKKLIKKVNDHPHFTEFVCIKEVLEPKGRS